VLQVRTDEAEGLFFAALLELIDFFDGLLVHDIAADTVIGVRWIGDDAPLF